VFLDGPCFNHAIIESVGDYAPLPCLNRPPGSFAFVPATADAQAMPSSFTISGDGIDGTYGMPLVDFYDEYGDLMASISATDLGIDGQGTTWLSSNPPYLTYNGTYFAVVSNVLADGSFDIVGVATVDVINGQDLPPLLGPSPTPDPGPCGQDLYNEQCIIN